MLLSCNERGISVWVALDCKLISGAITGYKEAMLKIFLSFDRRLSSGLY